MSPYAEFQKRLISWLKGLQENDYDLLVVLVSACRAGAKVTEWPQLLRSLGFNFQDEEWHGHYKFYDLVLEQIDNSGEQLAIRGVLGLPLHRDRTVETLEAWSTSTMARLRNERFAHVGALLPGDTLITGDKIASLPREGGNGSVLIEVSDADGKRACWLDYPGRTVLALAGANDGPLPAALLAK